MVFHFAEPAKIFITNTLMQHPFYGEKGGAKDKLGGEPQNNELPPYSLKLQLKVRSSQPAIDSTPNAVSDLPRLKAGKPRTP
jgi:hypothetical protein